MKVFYGGISLFKWPDLGVALVGTPSSYLYGDGLSINPALYQSHVSVLERIAEANEQVYNKY